MEKNTLIQVTNRDSGRVGYTVPELGVRRQFAPKETKEISFEELQALSYLPGGDVMLSQYLVVRNEEAVKELQQLRKVRYNNEFAQESYNEILK